MPACRKCFATVEEGHFLCRSCAQPSEQAPTEAKDPLIGKTLSGGYLIEELVGSGAMANVYRAEQTTLRRTVAVKVLHEHLMFDETTGRRFINEARATSRLNHPHSLAVIDFGRMDNKQPYMVMEFLRGHTLERVVREEGPLPFKRVIDILLQLLDALSEAHQLDIIHRDLKPENIVIEPVRSGGDFVKVVDFGLAKIMNTTDDISITATGTVCGTPDFMSPEQCRGGKLDARSDLYAVGVNLFVLLTGRVPFLADTPTQALLLHLTATPPDPRQLVPERLIPDSLAELLAKSMEKDPANRFQSAHEFAAALQTIRQELEGEPSIVPTPITTVRCSVCGGFSPAGTKFCVECGEPIGALRAPQMQLVNKAGPAGPQVSSQLNFVGRDSALVSLLDPLQTQVSTMKSMLVCGESGIGKTRLIQEFAGRALRRGHTVVHIEPDPWMVGVAYYALSQAICKLTKLPDNGGDPSDWLETSESERQGLAETFGRVDLLQGTQFNRRRAVRDALGWAVNQACASAGDGTVVIIFDDLGLIDGVSRRAAKDLLGSRLPNALFVIGTHTPDFNPEWPETMPRIDVERLSPSEALLVLEQSGLSGRMLELPTAPVTPLFLEQAVRYCDSATGRPPSRLGDLIDQRLTRLRAVERQVIQAVAVLGRDTTPQDIGKLISRSEGVEAAASVLVDAGLLKLKNGHYHFAHRMLKEVVLNTIPAGVHRELCQRVLNVISGKHLPMEARVWYTMGAENAFEALLMLDQVGAAALARDDTSTAVEAYHKGMDLARIELVRGNLDDPMHAVVLFGRKLGEALTAAGRPGDAEGVLREALDFAEPDSIDQAHIMLGIARAAYSRDRVPDAIRWAKQASQLAMQCGEDEVRDSIDGLLRRWGG